jgi:P pilus assembly chaperone PapD
MRSLFAAFCAIALAAPAASAVSVTPMALYIDSRTRSGLITLFNPGTLPEEITVDFAYGYPQLDGAGKIVVTLTREPAEGEPSALAWLRAFPRRLVLQPGQSQVVRVLVEAPAGLPDGEYWGRLVITSRGGQPPLESTQQGQQLQLNMRTSVVIAANYRNGNVDTGVNVKSALASRDGDSVRVAVDLERTGNAAYLGRLRAELIADGNVVATTREDLAIYRAMPRSYTLAVPRGLNAPLQVRFYIEAVREDLPEGAVLQAKPVEVRVPVTP